MQTEDIEMKKIFLTALSTVTAAGLSVAVFTIGDLEKKLSPHSDQVITSIPFSVVFDGNVAFTKPCPYDSFERKAYAVRRNAFEEIAVEKLKVKFPEGIEQTLFYCQTDGTIKLYPDVEDIGQYPAMNSNCDDNILYMSSDIDSYAVDFKEGTACYLFDQTGKEEFLNKDFRIEFNREWARVKSVSPDGNNILFVTNRESTNENVKYQLWIKNRKTGKEYFLLDGVTEISAVNILFWKNNHTFFYTYYNESIDKNMIYQYDLNSCDSNFVLSKTFNIFMNGKAIVQYSQDNKSIYEYSSDSFKIIDISSLNEFTFDLGHLVGTTTNRIYGTIVSADQNWVVCSLLDKYVAVNLMKRTAYSLTHLAPTYPNQIAVYGWTADDHLVIGTDLDLTYCYFATTKIVNPEESDTPT